jgi:hypothetical protein
VRIFFLPPRFKGKKERMMNERAKIGAHCKGLDEWACLQQQCQWTRHSGPPREGEDELGLQYDKEMDQSRGCVPRNWVSGHGFVYVPEKKQQKPKGKVETKATSAQRPSKTAVNAVMNLQNALLQSEKKARETLNSAVNDLLNEWYREKTMTTSPKDKPTLSAIKKKAKSIAEKLLRDVEDAFKDLEVSRPGGRTIKAKTLVKELEKEDLDAAVANAVKWFETLEII